MCDNQKWEDEEKLLLKREIKCCLVQKLLKIGLESEILLKEGKYNSEEMRNELQSISDMVVSWSYTQLIKKGKLPKIVPFVEVYEFEGKPVRVYVNEYAEISYNFEDVISVLGYNSIDESLKGCFKDEEEKEAFLKNYTSTPDPFVADAMEECL